ncbi:unnamed protein product [Onchocerca ochengi]|uniref:CFAP91 domain-containing protein n=1 Tax=Onchocerca ochengi TaxID=42157 RepID=A0A182EUB4_ONCOC|nr:unnamed protein product [Onchocerca ochengi]
MEKLLEEVKQMDLTPLDQMVIKEEKQQQYETRKRITEEKIMRFELHNGALETANAEWKQCIQQLPTTTRKREEEKYAQMVDDERVLQRLNQHQTKDEPTHPKESTKMALHQTVILP